jgi:hypothetical protein
MKKLFKCLSFIFFLIFTVNIFAETATSDQKSNSTMSILVFIFIVIFIFSKIKSSRREKNFKNILPNKITTLTNTIPINPILKNLNKLCLIDQPKIGGIKIYTSTRDEIITAVSKNKDEYSYQIFSVEQLEKCYGVDARISGKIKAFKIADKEGRVANFNGKWIKVRSNDAELDRAIAIIGCDSKKLDCYEIAQLAPIIIEFERIGKNDIADTLISFSGATPSLGMQLIEAVRASNLNLVKKLLLAGADPKFRCAEPIKVAVDKQLLEIEKIGFFSYRLFKRDTAKIIDLLKTRKKI